MENAINTALSLQTATFRKLNVVSNNVANASTKGFKGQEVLFQNYITDEGNNKKLAMVSDVGSFDNKEMGSFTVTNRPLDIAIQGDGYFVIDTPLGTRYSRAGNFYVNQDGVLSTADQHPVLSADLQQITIPTSAKNISFTSSGAIVVDGEETQTLAVANFEPDNFLEHVGNGKYKASTDSVPASGYQVLQGMLEEANVKSVTELKTLIDVQRSAGLISEFINSVGELERNSISKLTNSIK